MSECMTGSVEPGTVVFILGAGASKHAGLPLMDEFMEVAQDYYRRRRRDRRITPGDSEQLKHFERVLDAQRTLQQAHSKVRIDLFNLEALFGAFEMARTIGRLGSLPPQEVDSLSLSLVSVISLTLEQCMELPNRQQGIIRPGYDLFVSLVRTLLSRQIPVSIITFNYDTALDNALSYYGVSYDYHLENGVSHGLSSMNNLSGVPLLKIHGSLNWQIPDTMHDHKTYGFDPSDISIQEPDKSPHIDYDAPKEHRHRPLIVPPTLDKSRLHRMISNVWARAALDMSLSEHIHILGFSLPETDLFFRHLLALGTIGPNMLRTFSVWDPDVGVQHRFQQLLGPAASDRFSFRRVRFEDAIPELIQWADGLPPLSPRRRTPRP